MGFGRSFEEAKPNIMDGREKLSAGNKAFSVTENAHFGRFLLFAGNRTRWTRLFG